MRINYAIVLLILFPCFSYAQSVKYASPVDFPMALAGNVGEIRSNHFHTGIDIKATKGVGSAVKATAAGYVSRVAVSPTGYGKVLYVTHADGTTSVYAHLNGFTSAIATWVRDQQYGKKSYSVDLYPPRTMFAVQQGQTIAYLGNSGSSGGPHLHFEIRDAASRPLNMLSNKTFRIADNIAPNIYRIMLYECDTVGGAPTYSLSQSIDIKPNKLGEWELSDTILTASRPMYIAYEVIDYKNGSSNTMGIYSLSQNVAGTVNYSFQLDRISFATTRYINSMVQWDLGQKSKHHILRAYVSPNNALSIYRHIANRGIIEPPKVGGKVEVITEISDDNGNRSSVGFWIKGVEKSTPPRQPLYTHKVEWNREFRYEDSLLSVVIPQKALYETSLVELSKNGEIATVGSEDCPIQKSITVKIKQNLSKELQPYALLVNANNRSVGGAWSMDGVQTQTRSLGKFSIAIDTIPPTVKQFKTENNTLKFKIEDNLSGIRSYQVLIDGKWELGEFDAKTSMLTHKFKRNTQPVAHKIRVQVTDYKNNTTTINRSKEQW